MKLNRFAQDLCNVLRGNEADIQSLVSVIIPFFNGQKFIEEAIKSVFAQTYEKWELLLVDDGSSDRTTEIAREYTKRFPGKIRYLEHEGHQNKGISASRNLGIAHARGEFVAFLDQDDVWLPEKLEKQVSIMEQHPDIGLVFCPAFYWHEDGSKKLQHITISHGKHPPGVWVSKMIENDVNVAGPGSVLMRRNLIVRLGCFEESFRSLYEDMALWHKVALNALIYYDPEPLLLYRIHSASFTRTISYIEKLAAEVLFYSWFVGYLKDHNPGQFQSELCTLRVRPHRILVRYLVDKNQFDLAFSLVQCLEQQLPEPPIDAEWNYLAAFSLHQSRTGMQEALVRYDSALQYGFDEFWVRYNRGALHAEMGNMDEARTDLLLAIELNPDHEGAKQVLRQLTRKKWKLWR